MSAVAMVVDWKFKRALSAIASGCWLDLDFYCNELDLDEQELLELFKDAADQLGMDIFSTSRTTH